MHTDETYMAFEQEPVEVEPRALSVDLDRALGWALTTLDVLTAETTEQVLASAYSRQYSRLKAIRQEAALIGRIQRGE